MTCSKSFLALGFAAAICFSAAPASAQRRGGGHAGGGHAGGGYRGGAVVRGGGGGYRGGVVVRGGGGYRGGVVVRGGGGYRGGTVIRGGVAVVRPYGFGGARIISPRIVGYGAYRPYYYYRPGISIGFYAGFGYPYYYGYYGYPYYDAYPYYPPYAYTYPYPTYSTYPPYSTYPGYPASGGYSYPAQPQYGQQPQGAVTTQQAPATYGGVRIENAPHDAQVYVDGYYAGIVDDFDGANKHLNLTAGTHQVEIRMNGQQPIGFDVNVPPNQTITVRVP